MRLLQGTRLVNAILATLVAFIVFAELLTAPASAQARSTANPEASPPQVQLLLKLLADPKVEEWLKQQTEARASTSNEVPIKESMSQELGNRLAAIRVHIIALGLTIPDLPNQFWRGRARVTADLGENGRIKAFLLLLGFIGLGVSVEWLFRRMSRRVRNRLDSSPLEIVGVRLRIIAIRLALGVSAVSGFALGSFGPFLAFDWPPLLREMVLGYLVAFLVLRIAMVVGHFLLEPRDERFRVIPMGQDVARFWFRRLVVFVGWFAFGWATVGLGRSLGYTLEARQLVAYALGLGLVVIALESVWRRPASTRIDDAPLAKARRFDGASNVMLSVAIVVLWVFWAAQAMASFWLLLIVISLPLAIKAARQAVDNLLRAPDSSHPDEVRSSVLTVCIERAIRAALIVCAVAVLAWGWGVDVTHLHEQTTWLGRAADELLSVAVILLIADLIWHAAKTAIDGKLAGTANVSSMPTNEARRQARLHTLLPIFRNILFVAIIIVTAMMALAALGVEIGPLIAGAGVLGIAVGFGAQTFVRDVIAGMFYLLDDAFRVGEYIQAGNYKGTVEGFSIRSIRLRHHRGPVYTVPFSLLGAVQNQSRDWVIDKLTLGVTYDSDLMLAKKLIKQIGLDLAKDPDFAPLILEPLKMQGVDHFGDFAIQIRLKMMTLPGEQFVIRRQAYAMIKRAFDENGIKFAFPTVQLAGDGEPSTAVVAQHALERIKSSAA